MALLPACIILISPSLMESSVRSYLCMSKCIPHQSAELHLEQRAREESNQRASKVRKSVAHSFRLTRTRLQFLACVQSSKCWGKRVTAAFLYYNIWRVCVVMVGRAVSLPRGQWHTRSNLDCRMPTVSEYYVNVCAACARVVYVGVYANSAHTGRGEQQINACMCARWARAINIQTACDAPLAGQKQFCRGTVTRCHKL